MIVSRTSYLSQSSSTLSESSLFGSEKGTPMKQQNNRGFVSKCVIAMVAFCGLVCFNGVTNRKLVESSPSPEGIAFAKQLSSSLFSSSSFENNVVTLARSAKATGQQLLLDLVGCSDEAVLQDAKILSQLVHKIAKTLNAPVMNLAVTHHEPHGGASVVAALGDSHLTIHTWPAENAALVDILIADEDNKENLRSEQVLGVLTETLRGNLAASTFSLIPRGDGVDMFDNKAYHPVEIITRHIYKSQVSQEQSPYQNVEVWDHQGLLDEGDDKWTTRSLFLDGVVQSNIQDEYRYHETLVQSAFIAAGEDPKRVLIVGGGEGGTLRETLKWKSIEEAVMVDLDAEVVRSSRKHLSTYNNCTGFGTPSCFDDPRVKLYTEDFFGWFDKHYGKDICKTRDTMTDRLFDVIILDLLDPEELPKGQAWAEYLYSELFFERIACTTTDLGVVISNFGKAPDSPYDVWDEIDMYYPNPAAVLEEERRTTALQEKDVYEDVGPFRANRDSDEFAMARKMHQLRSFSSQFQAFRVFDTLVPSFRGSWAFALGIVPRISKSSAKKAKQGIEAFDGTPVQVDYKIKRGFYPAAENQYYDGTVQQGYQQPTADWIGAFCWFGEHSFNSTCNLEDRFDSNESHWWTVKTQSNKRKEVIAVASLTKGTILGAWDSVFPNTDPIAKVMTTSCKPNTALLRDAEPWHFDSLWNPFTRKLWAQLQTSVVLLRDVKIGEKLTLKGSNG